MFSSEEDAYFTPLLSAMVFDWEDESPSDGRNDWPMSLAVLAAVPSTLVSFPPHHSVLPHRTHTYPCHAY